MLLEQEMHPSETVGTNWLSATIRRELVHELGADLSDSFMEQTINVAPSYFPTVVQIKSTLRAGGARALRSPAYLASVRRRECGMIGRLIASLAAKADMGDDFIAWTHEPLDRIRRLIDKLSSAEEYRETEFEGNSCEILRQLRDTFLGNGWKSYRSDSVCATALSVLKHLSTEDEITSNHVYGSLEKLLNAGLSPAIGILPGDGEEEEIPD